MELHDPRKPANHAREVTVGLADETAVVGDGEPKTRCLPARLDVATLTGMADDQNAGPLEHGRRDLAAQFGFAGWEHVHAEVQRREILNARDVSWARQKIDGDPSWATRDLTGWCDHRRAGTLNYMAMLRFDAPRLGLSGPLDRTGEMARLLLAAGAPVDGGAGDRETPLITAASYGDAEVAHVLIEAGADLDCLAAPDAGGVARGSALLHAAVFSMTDVLDALVQAGAQTRSLPEAAAAGDISGWPLATAGQQTRVRALIMAADHQRLVVIDELLEAGTPIDAVDPLWGRHPLRLAAAHGRCDSTRHLLERGADPTLTDDRGQTALDLCQGGHRDLPGPGHDAVAALLQASIDKRARVDA